MTTKLTVTYQVYLKFPDRCQGGKADTDDSHRHLWLHHIHSQKHLLLVGIPGEHLRLQWQRRSLTWSAGLWRLFIQHQVHPRLAPPISLHGGHLLWPGLKADIHQGSLSLSTPRWSSLLTLYTSPEPADAFATVSVIILPVPEL